MRLKKDDLRNFPLESSHTNCERGKISERRENKISKKHIQLNSVNQSRVALLCCAQMDFSPHSREFNICNMNFI